MAETGLGDVAGIPKLGSNWSIILHSLISTGQLGGAGAGVGTKLEISIGQSPSEHWAINRTNYNFLPSPHPVPLGRAYRLSDNTLGWILHNLLKISNLLILHALDFMGKRMLQNPCYMHMRKY